MKRLVANVKVRLEFLVLEDDDVKIIKGAEGASLQNTPKERWEGEKSLLSLGDQVVAEGFHTLLAKKVLDFENGCNSGLQMRVHVEDYDWVREFDG